MLTRTAELDDTSWKPLGDVLKTSWRRMIKMNLFVLTKTSWRRIHQDKYLLGCSAVFSWFFLSLLCTMTVFSNVCLVCSALDDRRIFCGSYLTWFLLDIFNPFLTLYLKITFHLQYVNQRYFPKKLSKNMPKSSKSYKLFADRKFSTTSESFVWRTENFDFLGQYQITQVMLYF